MSLGVAVGVFILEVWPHILALDWLLNFAPREHMDPWRRKTGADDAKVQACILAQVELALSIYYSGRSWC